jgi:hypothetical protein
MMAWDEARVSREADPTNPKLIEAEYAAEREHFRRVREGQSWRRRVLTLVIIFAVAASAWQIKEIVQETQSNTAEVQALTLELHSALVESCQKNGNAARQVARETLKEEIDKAKHPDPATIHALNLPAGLIRRLTAENIGTLEARLERVVPVDCAKQYQISPGSGQRRRGSDSSP